MSEEALPTSPQLQALIQRQQAQIEQLIRLNEGLQRQLSQVMLALETANAQIAALTKQKHTPQDHATTETQAGAIETAPSTDQASEASEVDETEAAAIAASVAARIAARKATRKLRNLRRRRRKKNARAGQKPKRGALPAHLERIEKRVEVCKCPHCDSDNLYRLPSATSERLHYIPARVVVCRLVREKVRCRDCEVFTTAPIPPTAVPYGQMTAGFLAHIVYSKCGLHLPLARIIEDLKRQDVSLASSTACDAMGHAADLLGPVYDRLVASAFDGDLLHLDGTGLDVLLPGEAGKIRGQMAVCCNESLSLYLFSEDKCGVHFSDFLKLGTPQAFSGYLVADRGSNMNLLYKDGSIVWCACWQHAREFFVKALVSSPFLAEAGLAWIGILFDIEAAADAAGDTPEERLSRRRRLAPARLSGFEEWMKTTLPQVSVEEELAVAIRYCQRHRVGLRRFLESGSIPLTNNLAERELGVIGRGRKNYLFAGSDIGGRRLAVLYTVVRSCQRLEVDALGYLAWALPQLSDLAVNRGVNVLPGLLPLAFKQAREQAPTG